MRKYPPFGAASGRSALIDYGAQMRCLCCGKTPCQSLRAL